MSDRKALVLGDNNVPRNAQPGDTIVDGNGDPIGATGNTGTGFVHITAGVKDTAAKLVDTADINDAQVTLAKLANLQQDEFITRISASTGVPETATCTATGRALLDDTSFGAMRTTLGLAIGTNVQAFSSVLAALAALTMASDKGVYFDSNSTAATFDLTSAGRALIDDATAAAQRTTLGLAIGVDVQAYDAELAALAGLTSASNKLPRFTGSGTADLLDFSTDGTMAGNSDSNVPSEKAIRTYIATALAAGDYAHMAGAIDCSANPNYPAADAGDTYRVSVAGKIGGASGPNVEVGDAIQCFADGSAAGTQAAVGANWIIIQTNIDGAVVGPASAVSGNFATFNGTSGHIVQDSGLALDTDGTLSANSDSKIASQKATKTYVGAYAQPVDSELTALAGLTSAADKVPYFTGSGAAAVADFTSVARTLVAQTTQALMCSTGLGLGTIATQNANAVAVTGGTIDGATIGGSTPAAVTGTTITATAGFTCNPAGTANEVFGSGAGAALISGGTQNVFVGKSSGNALTTGDDNQGIGKDSLLLATTISGNVAIGTSSLAAATTTEVQATAVGYQSLKALTTGVGNSAFGYQSMAAATTSGFNSAFGYQTLSTVTTSDAYSTAVGYQALKAQSSGLSNTAVGYQCGVKISSGSQNTSMGESALAENQATDNNCAFGWTAMWRMRGATNSAFGAGAMAGSGTAANNTGTNNLAAGYSALGVLTSGTENSAVGAGSLVSATTATLNSALGRHSLHSMVSGSANIGLGAYSGYAATGSNTLYIGDTSQHASNYAIDTVTIASSNAAGPNMTNKMRFGSDISVAGNATFANTGLLVQDTDASNTLALIPGSNLSANRTLTITTGDASRTITLSGDTTLTGTNTGDQNLFASVIVSGQTTVTTGSTSQALTLVAGTNVTITTDNTAKSITITASGGGGGGSPGGSNTQIQYNDSAAFNGSANFTWANSSKVLAVGGSITSTMTDSGTGNTLYPLTIGHNTSATAGATFGTGIQFQAQDSTTVDTSLASITAYWTTATHGSALSQMNFNVMESGNSRSAISIAGVSGATKIGFFEGTPVIKPTSTTDLRTALINLGLYTTGGASPLNLNGGALTAGSISCATLSAATTFSDATDASSTSAASVILTGGLAVAKKIYATTLNLIGESYIESNGGSCLRLNADGSLAGGSAEIIGEEYGSTNAPRFTGMCAGTSKASPSATPAGSELVELRGGGHDGSTFQRNQGRFICTAGAIWSGSNRETIWTINGTPNASTTMAEWARFRDANLLIGGTTTMTGSGGLHVFGTTNSTSSSSGTFICDGGIGIADAKDIGLGTTTGTKIGTATTQKIGVYGVTPIPQRSGSAQAAVTTTNATQTSPWGFATSAQANAIVTLVNEMRAWAVAQGFIKGSA